MKNLVKFTALAVAILGTASVAGAQASLTSSLTAKAAVGASISIAAANMDFGTAYRSQGTKTIAANVDQAASFLITGTAGSQVGTTITVPGTLNSAAAGSTMPVAFSYTSVSTNGLCSTAAVGSTTTVASLFLSGSLATAGGTGQGRVCIGGTISPAVDQAIATDYTGTVNITVAFP